MNKGKLGVLGGMGPQATLLFYQRVIDFTFADTDQEHIPTLILSDSEMPDRTAALLSGQVGPVRAKLLEDARRLEDWGATAIAITDSETSPLAPISRYTLTARSDMASFVDSLVAPLSLVNALLVAVSQRKNEDLAQTFHRLEEIWEKYNVYEKVPE